MSTEPETKAPSIQLEETVRFDVPVDVTLSSDEALVDVAADLSVCRLRDGSAVFSLTSDRTPRIALALNEEQVAALRAVLGYSDEI